MKKNQLVKVNNNGFEIKPFIFTLGAFSNLEDICKSLIQLQDDLDSLINAIRCLQRLNNSNESPKILAAMARAYEAWCNETGWD